MTSVESSELLTMTASEVPQSLRRLIKARAQGRCEYCQTSEAITGLHCEIDHIIPFSRQGTSTEDNLCLACAACNGHKQARNHAVDPDSGKSVPLFNPRQQDWKQHFVWSPDGTEITGLTPTGRATVAALEMNDPLLVGARSLWVSFGVHPPKDQ